MVDVRSSQRYWREEAIDKGILEEKMRFTLMFGSVVVSVLVGLSALAAADDKGFVRVAP